MKELPGPLNDVKLIINIKCDSPRKLLQYLSTGDGINPRPFHQATPPQTIGEMASFLRRLKFPIYAEDADFYALYPSTLRPEHHFFADLFRSARELDRKDTQVFLDRFRESKLQLPAASSPTYMLLYSPSPRLMLDPQLSAKVKAWITPPVDGRSVGRTRKFAFLPPRIMEPMEAEGLSMLLIEVYRILFTHREYAKGSRKRIKGKGPAYRPPYTKTLQIQIADYLKERRLDLLNTARGKRRTQARKMGTSRSSVQRAIHGLCEAGWIARVYPGRPEFCPWLSPQEQDRRIRRHQRVSQWGPQKYMLATDIYQRDGLKGANRKLKELGLPPYLIYLPRS